jgi:hypothetical protein
VSGNLVTTSIAVMRTAAAAGLGLWLCPPFTVSDLLASGALVPLLPDYGRREMDIVALRPDADRGAPERLALGRHRLRIPADGVPPAGIDFRPGSRRSTACLERCQVFLMSRRRQPNFVVSLPEDRAAFVDRRCWFRCFSAL